VQTRLGARRSVVQTTSNLLGHAPSSLDNMVASLELANNTGIVDYCPFLTSRGKLRLTSQIYCLLGGVVGSSSLAPDPWSVLPLVAVSVVDSCASLVPPRPPGVLLV